MSSRAKAIADNIQDINNCYYPNSMYTNFVGSVLVCYTIFEKPSEEVKQRIKKQWLKVQKHPGKYYKSGDDFYDLEHTMKIFELERTYDWQVAVFISKHNTLLAPYGTTEDGKIFAYPIREDSAMGPTLAHPVSVHPVDWGEKKENGDNSNSNI